MRIDMVWRVTYAGYTDLYLADSYEDALEKARILSCNTSTFHFELVSLTAIRW